jgi:hypothetical protein
MKARSSWVDARLARYVRKKKLPSLPQVFTEKWDGVIATGAISIVHWYCALFSASWRAGHSISQSCLFKVGGRPWCTMQMSFTHWSPSMVKGRSSWAWQSEEGEAGGAVGWGSLCTVAKRERKSLMEVCCWDRICGLAKQACRGSGQCGGRGAGSGACGCPRRPV